MSAVLEVREPDARFLSAGSSALIDQFGLVVRDINTAPLRDLIISLAVRGRLVPQDPRDQTVADQLRDVRAEKDQLTRSGSIARPRPSAEVRDEEVPFAIPPSWSWVRLPEVCYDLGQSVPSSAFTYIDVGAIDNERAVVTDAVKVLSHTDAPSRARKRIGRGAVLYSTVRPYLKNIAIVARDYSPAAIASTAFAVLQPHAGVIGRYLLYYLRSPEFTSYVSARMVGVAYPAINDASFFEGVLPLPPTAEQARIVARVDELMRLCDALEEKGRLEAEQHARLLSTLLGTLTDSATPEELAANWQRVAEHFDLLLDRPEAIDALEEAVIELAIRGCLTQRTRSDRPAVEILEHIEHERTGSSPPPRRRAGSGGREGVLDPLLFHVPEGWVWAQLGELTLKVTDGTHHTPRYLSSGVPFISVKDIDGRTVSFDDCKYISPEEHRSINSRCDPRKGDILLCRIGTLGRPTIVDTDQAFSLFVSVGLLKLPRTIDIAAFLHLVLSSPLLRHQYDAIKAGGSHTNKLNLGDIPRLMIPLPPLAEQARIVARVTELRRLCATLRERLQAQRATQSRLAEALVEQALAG